MIAMSFEGDAFLPSCAATMLYLLRDGNVWAMNRVSLSIEVGVNRDEVEEVTGDSGDFIKFEFRTKLAKLKALRVDLVSIFENARAARSSSTAHCSEP